MAALPWWVRRGVHAGLSLHTAFLPPTFAAGNRTCPCLSVDVVPFLSVRAGVRAFLSVRRAPAGAACPCDARPPGLSVRAIGAGGPELQPASPLLSVDPGPCPVRYLSVTSVTTWPSMAADDTG